MGKRKTKKFIDKKNAITYDIIHRSQKDPLAADNDAPQHVLLLREDLDSDDEKDSTTTCDNVQKSQGNSSVAEENASQHMLPRNDEDNTKKRNKKKNNQQNDVIAEKISELPSTVFASVEEEEVGLLNRAAPIYGPRPELDYEIVAAMDDNLDNIHPDDQIEDNFIELANAECCDIDSDEEISADDLFSNASSNVYRLSDDENDYESSDEQDDQVGDLPRREFTNEETKSRFTEYSMSSSVIKRNEGLTQLDRKFDQLYGDYDDMEQGPLDANEIEGYINPDDARILQCVEEFEKSQTEAIDNIALFIRDRLKCVNYQSDDDDENDDLHKLAVEPREREKWDCETILSTYSTAYNHPKLIDEPKRIEKIKIDPKTGIPRNVLGKEEGKLTAKHLAKLNDEYKQLKNNYNTTQSIAETMVSKLSTLSIRPKNETPEERKKRKQDLKDYRKQRRIERKANIEAFKQEKKIQEKIALNNKKNSQFNRIL